MSTNRMVQRLALGMAVGAFAGMGFLALSANGTEPVSDAGFAAIRLTAPLAPTVSTGASYAPENPVDCTDPNNAVNCQGPPIDSPLTDNGTAAPGSPYRD